MDLNAAIKHLNSDFSRLPFTLLCEMEEVLVLASGQLSSRRLTLPGDNKMVRAEVRAHFLAEAAALRTYLDPAESFPPEAIGLTDATCRAQAIAWEDLADTIRH